MNGKTIIARVLMLGGIALMPIAILLGFKQGMGAEIQAFVMGLILFGCGQYLQRNFGD